MALKEKGMIKTVLGNTDLSLTALPGESFVVRDVKVYNPASNYATLKTDKTTVGYFRVAGQLGNHLPFPNMRTQHSHDLSTSATAVADQTSFASLNNAGGVEAIQKILGGLAASTVYRRMMNYCRALSISAKTLLGFLAEREIFKGYPVSSGQTFLITGVAQANAIQVIEYDLYDEADILRDMPNGSEAAEYLFVNYGQSGAAINVTGDTLFATANNPKEFPAFPFGADVPANVIISLFGILASDFAPLENDGTNYILTQYLKLYKERTVLFDKDRNGIPLVSTLSTAQGSCDAIAEGFSLVGNFSDADQRPPMMFDPALEFVSGEELTVYLTTAKTGTGQNISAAEQEVAFIQQITRK